MAILLSNYRNTIPQANCGQFSLMTEILFDMIMYSLMLLKAVLVSIVTLTKIKLSVAK
jgi:hypothetical protein